MGNLYAEQIYKVNATDGLHLRSKPVQSKTNSIHLMVYDSIVTRLNSEVRTSSNYEWYNVRYIDEDKDVNGWAATKYLELQQSLVEESEPPVNPPPQSNTPAGGPPVTTSPSPVPVVTQVAVVTDVFYNKTRKLGSAFLMSIPSHIPGGPVKYNFGRAVKNTSLANWNAAAAPNSKLTAGKG